MTYVLRQKNVHKAFLNNRVAGRCMNEVKGHWELKKFTSSEENCFVFDQETTFGTDDMRIVIDIGDYLSTT